MKHKEYPYAEYKTIKLCPSCEQNNYTVDHDEYDDEVMVCACGVIFIDVEVNKNGR